METPFVGAWTLITFEFRKADGKVIYPFGEKARGSLIYTGSGRYSAQLMCNDRPRFAIPDQMQGTLQEIEANYKGCISYFGTYEVDYARGIVLHHVESSIFPNMEGTDQKRFFKFSGNCLQLTTPTTKLGGQKATGVLLWQKVE